MIHTQTEIDNLVELAIIQRAELKKLVESLPQLRDHLSSEIERNLEEIEPAIRSELEQFVTARALDAHAQTSTALTAKIDELARSLETTTAARYSVLIAEREKNESLLAQAEARIAEAASALPGSVKEIVAGELARFPRAGEIDQLRKEFAEPKGLNPRGKWSPDETYQRLDLVTINGDSFVSNIDGNRERPSRSAADWTLNAARGNSGGGGGVTSITDLLPIPSSGQILGSEGPNYVPKNLVAGSNITITGDEGQIELQDGTAAAPSLFFVNDTDTGLFRVGANTLGIAVGGTQAAAISSATFAITPNTTIAGTLTANGTSIPASKTLVVTTDKISVLAATSSAELAGVISDETGSGSLVFASSPTLVTPDLGTPSALVGTNITGTAAGLTAGNVTTNANLTGDVTSVGNATSIAAGVIVDADINASAAIVDTKLATISTAGKVSNSATTATSANTASAIVARDASGNFTAGTITANLTGNVSGSSGSTTGNAATATALQTARAINGVNFDGTSAITVTAAAGTLSGTTLAAGVTASSLTSLGTIASLTATAGTIATTPSGSTDIANKLYVDTVAQGLDAKASCVAATTADITLSGAQTIDGVSVVAGNRVLVKNQSLSQNNGIYLCASGSWTRTTDADTWDELTSAFTFIEQGTVNADTGYVCTANAGGTLGTTALPWSQFSGAGTFTAGTGLTLTGSVFSLTTPVAVANGGTGLTSLGSGVATFLGTPSSANLAAAVSDETGSGALVFASSPTLVTPNLGAASATSIAASGTVTGSNLSGTNTGDQTTITGNAGSATILQTARNINGVSFNGSADITVTAAAGTLTGATLASGVTASSLTSLGTIASLVATTADINGGTIDGTAIGVATPSTVAATSVGATDTVTINGGSLFGTSPTLRLQLAGVSKGYLGTASGTDVGVVGTVSGDSFFRNTAGKFLVSVNDGSSAQLSLTSTGLNSTAIGATTPSTVAATTGTFDAAGTADPAILVGAAGTGVNAGTITLRGGSGTGGGAFIRFTKNATAQGYIGNDSAVNGGTSNDLTLYTPNNVRVYASNTQVGTFTSTGLNSTAIGATTPSTGAFTTLSASNTVSQDFNGAGGNSFTARYNSSNPRGGVYVQGGSGKVFFGENLVHSTANVFVADKAGTAWALADSGGSNVGLFYATGLTAGATAFDFSTTTGRILSVSSTGLAVTGALSSTTGANFATSSGNVGIGTSSPSHKLDIYDSGTTATARVNLNNAGISAGHYSQFMLADNNQNRAFWRSVRDGSGATQFAYNAYLAFLSDAGGTPTERMRIDSAGNVGIGTASFGTSAATVLGIANGTAPSSSPAGMGQLYVEGGALKYRGSSGTVTTIANA